MSIRTPRPVSFLALLVVAGCASSSGGDPPAPGPDPTCTVQPAEPGDEYPCDVEAILAAKCRRCHTSTEELDRCYPAKECERAPFPLLTFADSRQDIGDGTTPVAHIADAVRTGFMPFQSTRLTTPVEPLTESETSTLIDWANACGPPAAAACP